MNISWDPNRVTMTACNTSLGNADFEFTLYSVNQSGGYCRIDAYQIDDIGLTNSINITRLHFTTSHNISTSNHCNITIMYSELWDTSLQNVAHQQIHGLITIIGDQINQYDINSDGIVNFQDAGLVWANRMPLSGYNSYYDVNADMDVDFQDAGLVWVNRD